MGNTHGSLIDRRGKTGDSYHHIGHQKIMAQSSEDDSVPVFCKPKSPSSENIDSLSSIPRPVLNLGNKKVLPCVIKWLGGGKDVALAGTFNNWNALPMVKSEKDFVAIVDLPEGVHEYKFLVDGEWKVSGGDKSVSNQLGTENNVLVVKDSDFEELENALLKDPNDKRESPFGESRQASLKLDGLGGKEEYGQIIPDSSPSEKKKGPPVLPPHLLQVILNKDTPVSCEPTLLPEPNHVMLNHMYALSIRDGMMVLSTSHRYRKKCVTTLIYRPI